MAVLRTVIVLCCLSVSLCQQSVPPTPALTGCDYKGVHYKLGENFRPHPCEQCFCTARGDALCALTDCPYPYCVDAVHDPTQCCPVCPNGGNCRHKDGTLIKADNAYRPDPLTVCRCLGTSAICLPERPGNTTTPSLVPVG